MTEKTKATIWFVIGLGCLILGAFFEILILMAVGNISMAVAILMKLNAVEW